MITSKEEISTRIKVEKETVGGTFKSVGVNNTVWIFEPFVAKDKEAFDEEKVEGVEKAFSKEEDVQFVD